MYVMLRKRVYPGETLGGMSMIVGSVLKKIDSRNNQAPNSKRSDNLVDKTIGQYRQGKSY